VDGESCLNVTSYDSYSQLFCNLPPGSGARVSLVASIITGTSDTISSLPIMLLGYADPYITRVAHVDCLPSNTSGSVTSCPRIGGGTLTVIGNNFGSADAVVLIDGELCVDVVHDEQSPHYRLRCTLPAGTAANAAIVFIQAGGSVAIITNSSATVRNSILTRTSSNRTNVYSHTNMSFVLFLFCNIIGRVLALSSRHISG